jgi:prefoldin subunit 5
MFGVNNQMNSIAAQIAATNAVQTTLQKAVADLRKENETYPKWSNEQVDDRIRVISTELIKASISDLKDGMRTDMKKERHMMDVAMTYKCEHAVAQMVADKFETLNNRIGTLRSTMEQLEDDFREFATSTTSTLAEEKRKSTERKRERAETEAGSSITMCNRDVYVPNTLTSPTKIGNYHVTVNESTTEDDKVPTENDKVPLEDDKVPLEDDKVPTEYGKVPTEDGKVPTEDGKVPTEDDKVETDMSGEDTVVMSGSKEDAKPVSDDREFDIRVNAKKGGGKGKKRK